MNSKIYKTSELYRTNASLAYDFVLEHEYPWEALAEISEKIMCLGATLPGDKFDIWDKNIWIAKSANVSKSAFITGPCIIDEGAEIRHCAYIRGGVIAGKNVVVGNSTELKNCILFDGVQVPHYNYVGDSILGYKSHMGAGAITSNVKSDRSSVAIKSGSVNIQTGLKKCGAFLGDFVEIGCGAVLNPGTIIGNNSIVYPLSSVRGVVGERIIYKRSGEVVDKI